MRFLASIIVLFSLAACWQSRADLAGADDDGPNPNGPPRTCELDIECVAAGAKCCDCPTFAVLAADPYARSCSGVVCPMTSCPQNVEAQCNQGDCILACAPLACATSEGASTVCPEGYALDGNGCLTCECASALGGCTTADDCVQTREDCCGCSRGGSDTAVLASNRAAFDAALQCPPSPQCPSIDTCVAGETPQCVQGRCELLTAPPPNACGRPDLPVCPAGTVCTVNTSDQADMHGLGLCVAL